MTRTRVQHTQITNIAERRNEESQKLSKFRENENYDDEYAFENSYKVIQ
jgi:hypothetical protein